MRHYWHCEEGPNREVEAVSAQFCGGNYAIITRTRDVTVVIETWHLTIRKSHIPNLTHRSTSPFSPHRWRTQGPTISCHRGDGSPGLEGHSRILLTPQRNELGPVRRPHTAAAACALVKPKLERKPPPPPILHPKEGGRRSRKDGGYLRCWRSRL